MIQFFRRIRKKLFSESKPAPLTGRISTYIIYAMGEIVLVVIGILIALSINNWNDQRKETKIENKILVEISNGLSQDLLDIKLNTKGHNDGLKAIGYWHKIFTNTQVDTDSISDYYQYLTRNFNSIQNKSGYESLKSRGLELIKDDSLRIQIIQLYEQDYSQVRKLEEEDFELKFHENYFKEINHHVSPNLIFDEQGEILSIQLPLNLTESEQKKMLSYLWKIKNERHLILYYNARLLQNVLRLQTNIEKKITKG